MKDTKTKTKSVSRETVVAEPEMAYGQGRAGQWCLMPYFIPKKDLSFLRDLAKVRGWRPAEDDIQTVEVAPANKQRKNGLDRALEDVKAGRIHYAKDTEDMFEQILGKDWKAKTKPAASAKTARGKRSVAPKAECKRSKHLDESLRQIENGEYFEASSAEEMCEQIFGKGWRTR